MIEDFTYRHPLLSWFLLIFVAFITITFIILFLINISNEETPDMRLFCEPIAVWEIERNGEGNYIRMTEQEAEEYCK